MNEKGDTTSISVPVSADKTEGWDVEFVVSNGSHQARFRIGRLSEENK